MSKWEEVDLGLDSTKGDEIILPNNIILETPPLIHSTWKKEEQRVLPYYYEYPINECYSFLYQYNGYHLGLLKDKKVVIPCDYSFITMPIDGWCFAIKKYLFIPGMTDYDRYFVILCDVENRRYDFIKACDIIVAADNLKETQVIKLLHTGAFKLYKTDDDRNNLHSYSLHKNNISIFNKSFVQLFDTPVDFAVPLILPTYWMSETVAMHFKHPKKVSTFHSDNYGLMDALDGDSDAYWNID